MPLNSDYFEEAIELLHDPDPVVARTARTLYREMLRRNQVEGLKACGNFNIYYFFQSVPRVLRAIKTNVPTVAPSYRVAEMAINAVNLPQDTPVDDISRLYVELVKSESIPGGVDFDVRYAISIISTALTNETASLIWNNENLDSLFEPNVDDDFDYWLSGFNSERG